MRERYNRALITTFLIISIILLATESLVLYLYPNKDINILLANILYIVANTILIIFCIMELIKSHHRRTTFVLTIYIAVWFTGTLFGISAFGNFGYKNFLEIPQYAIVVLNIHLVAVLFLLFIILTCYAAYSKYYHSNPELVLNTDSDNSNNLVSLNV
jgi:hypothetical protein